MKTKQLSTFFFFLLCFVIMNVYCNHKLQQFTIAKYGLQNKIKEQKNNNNKPKKTKEKRQDLLNVFKLSKKTNHYLSSCLYFIYFYIFP